MPVISFTAGSLGDILATAGLTAQVAKVLYDSRNISEECETLATELRYLQQVLILTELALQRYESTPLGEPLAHFIRPEVAQCHLSLKRFSDRIDGCRQALTSTTISNLWRRVVWAASDEAVSLSAKLSNHRSKLALLLMSLHSTGLLDTQSSRPNNSSQMCIQSGPLSIQRIKDKTINVVDHLGDTIPVSTLFCSSWESFHYIIKGYCINRIGEAFVERGDYQIVRAEGEGQIIDPSSFVRVVREGETLEMSIILRSTTTYNYEDEETKCPRCSHANIYAPSEGGWMRCSRCSCRFNVDLHQTQMGKDTSLGEEGIDDSAKTVSRYNRRVFQEGGFFETKNDISDAKYFRRITLQVQRLIIRSPRESTRGKLKKALQLANEGVQKDANENPEAAINAYAQSIAILSEVIECVRNGEKSRTSPQVGKKRRAKSISREEEIRRLQNIHDTYANRIGVLSTIYSVSVRHEV